MNNGFYPTLHLLSSSILTAFSGSTRLYIAFLLSGISPDFFSCLAAGLIIYSTYTLDRSLESKEDAINNSEFHHARRDIGVNVSVFSFLLGAVLFMAKNTYIAPFVPVGVGLLYSKGIRIRNHEFRLKGSLGGKNLVIGLTWGGTIALVIAHSALSIMTVFAVFFFYFGKLFFNSVIYDMKDTEGDMCAGIRTLPVVLGERNTKLVLYGLCVTVHLFVVSCMVTGAICPEIIIIIISFFSAFGILLFYSSSLENSVFWIKRNLRILLIDCEAPAIVVLRLLIAS